MIAFPIYSVQIFYVEFIFYLLPYMIRKYIRVHHRLVVEESFEFYRFGFTTADSNFLDTTLAAKEQILVFLIRKQGSATPTFFMTIFSLCFL